MQTGRQTDLHISRQADRKTETGRQTDKQTGIQADRKTDWQTDKNADR